MRLVQLCRSLSILLHCLSLELERKLTFSSSVATAEYSKFAGILSAALSQHHFFRIWNSSTGIPSPPLALFVVMLFKAHLTSHSRMSGSRCVITPWLSGSWRSFLYSSSFYSCHLFLISSASVRSIRFLSYGLIGSYSPRDSLESSPTPQFESINFLALRLVVHFLYPFMAAGKIIVWLCRPFSAK